MKNYNVKGIYVHKNVDDLAIELRKVVPAETKDQARDKFNAEVETLDFFPDLMFSRNEVTKGPKEVDFEYDDEDYKEYDDDPVTDRMVEVAMEVDAENMTREKEIAAEEAA